MKNTLSYCDDLDILRRYISDQSVDLIYLDPLLNSNAKYNILSSEKTEPLRRTVADESGRGAARNKWPI